jgi:hypothetical protein
VIGINHISSRRRRGLQRPGVKWRLSTIVTDPPRPGSSGKLAGRDGLRSRPCGFVDSAYNAYMGLPFWIFLGLLFFARHDLGWKWVGFLLALVVALFIGFVYAGLNAYVFIAALAVLDCILILVLFKGDIRIT